MIVKLGLGLWALCAAGVMLATTYDGGGDQLAYTTSDPDGYTIVLHDIERDLTVTIYRSAYRIFGIDWSPEGESLYFGARRGGSFYGNLAVLDVASGDMRWLTDSDNTDNVHPSVSPAGDRLVFQYYESGQTNWDIMLLDIASGEITALYQGISADTSPAWSPDGRFIAFETASVGRNTSNVMIYDLHNDSTARITTGMDGTPSWIRDGSGLLFASQQNRRFDIFAMTREGESRRRLTASAYGSFHPVDNGNRIAYIAWVNTGGSRNTAQVFVMDRAGETHRRITQTRLDHHNPVWRPR